MDYETTVKFAEIIRQITELQSENKMLRKENASLKAVQPTEHNMMSGLEWLGRFIEQLDGGMEQHKTMGQPYYGIAFAAARRAAGL